MRPMLVFATAPRLRMRNCIGKAVRLAPVPRDGRDQIRATALFAVTSKSEIAHFQILEPLSLPTDVGRDIERAIRSCAWVAGSAPDGPLPIWVLLPLRFAD